MATASYLLDTHCLIWFQENNPKIPEHIMSIIQNPSNQILFSQISLFEISIKQIIGKLPGFSASLKDVYEQAIADGFTFLSISNQHLYNYTNIPLLEQHRDPFDRLLISIAHAENAVILSADNKLNLYSDLVKVVW